MCKKVFEQNENKSRFLKFKAGMSEIGFLAFNHSICKNG
jgi:hypothetical protein